eukprot:CAMPEP_0202861824 /NCGR_PEP_ID=MMETSP1391-20130828/3083_1 /ASSEMBLY_ACC=CAM_ASM_000867 /TAXON_ID=1034604 /ORGANISM="Chlamydomonas leiostraca, Strain SAG 11-49" /LENGTH=410 /DNA_ID=CAMNT_0049541261 /DNA_START=365 /DNA_END=1597 /DNA_ORIENTATION=+
MLNVANLWQTQRISDQPRDNCSTLGMEHTGRLVVVLDLDETLVATYHAEEAPQELLRTQRTHRLQLPFTRRHHAPPIRRQGKGHASLSQLAGAGDVQGLSPTKQGPTKAAKGSSTSARTSSEPSSPAHLSTRSKSAFDLARAPGAAGPNSDGLSPVVVVERPGLQPFLKALQELQVELVVFTASAPSYALPIVRAIDPDGSVFGDRVLFRAHTIPVSCHFPDTLQGQPGPKTVQCIKDLACLGRDLARVVLVDNSHFSCMMQPSNAVPCMPFHGDPDDRCLQSVLCLLQSLALYQDVRPILDARFKLAAQMAKLGMWPLARNHSGPLRCASYDSLPSVGQVPSRSGSLSLSSSTSTSSYGAGSLSKAPSLEQASSAGGMCLFCGTRKDVGGAELGECCTVGLARRSLTCG